MVNYYYVYIYTNEHICNVKFLFMAVFVWIRKKSGLYTLEATVVYQ